MSNNQTNNSKVIKSIAVGALLAASLGAAAYGVVQRGAEVRVYNGLIQPTISESCSPAGPYQGNYHTAGVSTVVASSLLLKHPERTKEICAIVNNSLNVATEQKKALDNGDLYALANSLGLDLDTAQQVIFQNIDREQIQQSWTGQELLKATLQAPALDPIPLSMEPNL